MEAVVERRFLHWAFLVTTLCRVKGWRVYFSITLMGYQELSA